MPITEILQKNADFYPNDTSLVEINPKLEDQVRMTWQEYSLIVSNPNEAYRKEITWGEFNKKANRFANLLLTRGIKKGDKDVYDSEIAKTLDVIKSREAAGLDIDEQKKWIDTVSYNYNLANADAMRVKADNVNKTGYADNILYGKLPGKKKKVTTVVSKDSEMLYEANQAYGEYLTKLKDAENGITAVKEWLINNGIKEDSDDGQMFIRAFERELAEKNESLLSEYSSKLRSIAQKYNLKA